MFATGNTYSKSNFSVFYTIRWRSHFDLKIFYITSNMSSWSIQWNINTTWHLSTSFHICICYTHVIRANCWWIDVNEYYSISMVISSISNGFHYWCPLVLASSTIGYSNIIKLLLIDTEYNLLPTNLPYHTCTLSRKMNLKEHIADNVRISERCPLQYVWLNTRTLVLNVSTVIQNQFGNNVISVLFHKRFPQAWQRN